ncbi:MAG: hypothetical protein KKH94_05470 [Candidatus Omnitrophica bacterium]|nr:hypothetical protein [Candidatus Omnitrophota bacterium]
MKDIYAQYKGHDLWCIKEHLFDKSIQNVRESQFALGNGLIGLRGVLEEKPNGAMPGTYCAGIFDRMTAQVSELVNFPNPLCFKFSVKGEKFDVSAMDSIAHERILNMYDGLLLRRTVYQNSKKQRFDYQSIRFVSLHEKNIGFMQMVLTPLDADAEIEIQTGIDIAVDNKGTVTEGNKRHFIIKELSQDTPINSLAVETCEKRHAVIFHHGFYYQIHQKRHYCADTTLRLKLKKNVPTVFTQVFSLVTSEPDERSCAQKKKEAVRFFKKAFHGSFTTYLKRHTDAWHTLWDRADIAVEGTADIQKNLRFNLYHMLICGHDDEGFSSIGARTLSGEGYRGHVFWDAEIFMLPFYAYVMPKTARNMLLYRYNRLDKARENALQYGYAGAMFPWESAGIGEDETPTWAKNIDGTIIRINTNRFEHHITADIMYALCLYVDITGDHAFMRSYGYEMMFESARFWASRVNRNKRGKYEINGVIGPDEFHENVNNNAYTNLLAQWNLSEAYKLYLILKKNDRQTHKTLRSKIVVNDKEADRWKYIAERIVFKQRRDKVIEQFDGFFKKRYVRIDTYDENSIPQLPKGVKVKEYAKTQLVKQADVMMLLYLLRDRFSPLEMRNNFNFYIKRTLHKSSLSPAIYCLTAIEADALSRPYQLFNVALRADISNLHNNSDEGMHAASLGGVWQCMVHGFAGIRRARNILSIHPCMPQTWHTIRLSLLWRGNCVRVEAGHTSCQITIESSIQKKVAMKIYGKKYLLRVNKKHTFRKGKVAKKLGYY